MRGLKTQKKPGRPSDVDENKLERIKKTVEHKCAQEQWDVGQVREFIQEKSGKCYTLRHTTRIIQRWGLAMITPRPQYMHAASQAKQRAFLKEKHPAMEEMAKQWMAHPRPGREYFYL